MEGIEATGNRLECWSAGVLECWSAGVLECWSAGVGVVVDLLMGVAKETGRRARYSSIPLF